MARTAFVRRNWFLVPAARRAAFQTFWTLKIDPGDGGNTFNVGLSLTGAAGSATFYLVGAQLTEVQMLEIVQQLAQVAGIALPDWANMTGVQKQAWLTTNVPQIQSATGIRFRVDPGDGAWQDIEALISAAGLKRCDSGVPPPLGP